MPLGFSGAKDLIAMGERYGVRRAQQIEQDGLKIEGALQKVTANRQIQGLGQTLAQLDPQTPDYTQKLMEIAPQFPEAMRDPRGQALFSMGVMANKQWEQRQAQSQQANAALANQQSMQGMRQRDAMAQIAARNQGRTNQEVDLSGLNIPQRLTPQNPATGLMTGGMSAPMESAQNTNAPDETAQLMGMSGDLGSISERALTPLRDAQQMTGVKPNRAQVFSAIAGERTREQQQKLLDDRQAQQDKTATTKQAESERKETQAKTIKKENAARTIKRGVLTQKRKETGTEIENARKALEKFIDPEKEEKGRDKAYFSRKTQLEAALERAGKEAAALDEEILTLVDLSEDVQAEQQGLVMPSSGGLSPNLRIIERNGKKYEVDDETKRVLREVK